MGHTKVRCPEPAGAGGDAEGADTFGGGADTFGGDEGDFGASGGDGFGGGGNSFKNATPVTEPAWGGVPASGGW